TLARFLACQGADGFVHVALQYRLIFLADVIVVQIVYPVGQLFGGDHGGLVGKAFECALELGAHLFVVLLAVLFRSVPRLFNRDNYPSWVPAASNNHNLIAFEERSDFGPKYLNLNLYGAELYRFVDRRICTVQIERNCTAP